jgi:hypothetical protein
MASRSDGVLVKPDAAFVPMDIDYINEAKKANKPMLAFTYTQHNNLTTDYVFAFTPNDNTSKDVIFKPAALGQTGNVVVYDPLTHSAKMMQASKSFKDGIGKTGYTYYLIAPVTANGIAFLGDSGKIASTGKQRIANMHASKNALQVKVAFASGEQSVTLCGYSEEPVTADKGKLTIHPGKNMFDLVLKNPKKAAKIVTVRLTTR